MGKRAHAPAQDTLDQVRTEFDKMQATEPPPPERQRRHPKRAANNVHQLVDEASNRKYTVEYLVGSSGKLARERGRVALTLGDLPPAMRKLPKLRSDGRYMHVAVRPLKLKHLSSRSEWYQPMFKKRWTRIDEHGNKTQGQDWFTCLGSYWDEGVAAVVAELAIQMSEQGKDREELEKLEDVVIEAARKFCAKR